MQGLSWQFVLWCIAVYPLHPKYNITTTINKLHKIILVTFVVNVARDPLSGPRWQIHCQDERSPNRRWEIDPQSLMWEGQKGASQLLALSWRAQGNSLAVSEHWKKILDSVVQAYSLDCAERWKKILDSVVQAYLLVHHHPCCHHNAHHHHHHHHHV